MKNCKILLLTALIIVCNVVGKAQNTYWVSNRNDGVVVDFTDLNTAYNTASPGDTLIVYPSPYGYGSLSIYKLIHIRGIGYSIDTLSQPSIQIKTFQSSPVLAVINFLSGSDGSSIESFVTGQVQFTNSNNCLLKRSKITGGISMNTSFNNYITSCYIHVDGASSPGIFFTSSSNNVIQNNYFTYPQYHTISISSSNSLNNVFINNIFGYGVQVNNSTLYNNIFLTENLVGEMNTINNNIFCFGTPGIDGNDNQYGATNVFVGWPTQGNYSFDSRWQLAPGSPAIGAGVDGVDCGIFDGQYPYKLSGIANMPLIYDLQVPLYVPAGGQLPVTIKVRSEN